MPAERSVGELIDVVVVAIFFFIFYNMISPYLNFLTANPSSNTLGNFKRVIGDAVEGNDARYPMILNKENDYSLFGKGIYLIQVQNLTGLPGNMDNIYFYTTKNTIPIQKSCDKYRTCICTLSILFCNGSSSYTGNWKKFGFLDQYPYHTSSQVPVLAVSNNEKTVKSFTMDFLNYADETCTDGAEVEATIIYCTTTNDAKNVILTHKNDLIALFPIDAIQTKADKVELRMIKTSEEEGRVTVDFDSIIKTYK